MNRDKPLSYPTLEAIRQRRMELESALQHEREGMMNGIRRLVVPPPTEALWIDTLLERASYVLDLVKGAMAIWRLFCK